MVLDRPGSDVCMRLKCTSCNQNEGVVLCRVRLHALFTICNRAVSCYIIFHNNNISSPRHVRHLLGGGSGEMDTGKRIKVQSTWSLKSALTKA